MDGHFLLAKILQALGGDSEYIRSSLGGRYYYEIARDWVLSAGANAGYIYNYGSKDLRINDRFFKGGNTFRAVSYTHLTLPTS